MKTYYPMMICYEEGKEPWLWSTYNSCLTIEECEKAIQTMVDSGHVKPIVTWLQEYDKETRKDTQIKYYVNALGVVKNGLEIGA